MTLGPTIALLPLVDGARGAIARWLTVFGRVPFFYYVLHIPLIHALALIVSPFGSARSARGSSPTIPWGRHHRPTATRGVSRCSTSCGRRGRDALLRVPLVCGSEGPPHRLVAAIPVGTASSTNPVSESMKAATPAPLTLALVFSALLPLAACGIDVQDAEQGKKVDIRSPLGSVNVRTDVENPDTGLPRLSRRPAVARATTTTRAPT